LKEGPQKFPSPFPFVNLLLKIALVGFTHYSIFMTFTFFLNMKKRSEEINKDLSYNSFIGKENKGTSLFSSFDK